jgi:hypothetical protein
MPISSGPLGDQSHTPAPVEVVDRGLTPEHISSTKSWASTVSPIWLGLVALQSNWKEYRPVAGILHVNVTMSDGTENGFLIDGYIRLKSHVIPGFFITPWTSYMAQNSSKGRKR